MAEPTPVFGEDFDRFQEFLSIARASGAISPERFCQVLGMDRQALASRAHVHPSTVRHAPQTACLQDYLRQSIEVMHAATDVAGSVEDMLFWFMNYPLSTFDYKMPVKLA